MKLTLRRIPVADFSPESAVDYVRSEFGLGIQFDEYTFRNSTSDAETNSD